MTTKNNEPARKDQLNDILQFILYFDKGMRKIEKAIAEVRLECKLILANN